jgi:hypothetical protein
LDIVLRGEVVEFEIDLLNLEIVGLHFAGLAEQFGGFGDHLLEDDLGDAASAGLGVAHQQDIHVIIIIAPKCVESITLLIIFIQQ